LQHYSQRLSWCFSTNSFSRLIEEKRQSGAALLDLTTSNPTEALADYPHGQINRAYAEVSDFRYQPDAFGALQAREAVATEYAKRGLPVSPEQVALTASTSEAYALLFKMFCDAGDEVLVPVPSYPLFEYLARLECVNVVPYPLVYDGNWYIDFPHLKQQINARTRAIVIVNPNNPTGSFLKTRERSTLAELAAEYGLPIISDEVFMDYSIEENSGAARTMVDCDEVLNFSLNGLSKMAGMPQVKLGWIVVSGPKDSVETARMRLELILDTYLSVNTPAQYALRDLFEIGAHVQAKLSECVRQNYSFLRTELASSAIHMLRAEGGWSAVLQLPRIMPEEVWIKRLLAEQNVVVQPGYFFDMPSEAYAVVSLITQPQIMAEGVGRLQSLLA